MVLTVATCTSGVVLRTTVAAVAFLTRMRALSIRQPFADQILRGKKRVEYRSIPTRIVGRVYIYASARPATLAGANLPRGVIVGTVGVSIEHVVAT